jgi:hypothetical protein
MILSLPSSRIQRFMRTLPNAQARLEAWQEG